MADIICLSSDEEERPKKKRVKLTRVADKRNCPSLDESIVLSDDDEDSRKSDGKEKSTQVPDDLKVQDDVEATNSVTKDPSDNEEKPVDEENGNETPLHEEQNGIDLEENKENSVLEEPVESETDINFREFCAKCRVYIENLDERQMLTARMDKLVQVYDKLKKYNSLDGLDTFLCTEIKQMQHGSSPIISFHSVFKWALDKYESVKQKRIKNAKTIKTLIHKINELSKKISKLKEAEVDLDDDEGSSYLQCEAYERRLISFHTQLCKLEGTDPNEGRITYLPLRFSHSTNPLINKAINYKYKDSNFLPDFYEFNKLIRKVAVKGAIKMSDEKLKLEIRSCFEHLTKVIKRNRQRELYEVQSHFVENVPDETLQDKEFNTKIYEGRQKSIKQMNEVINKFVELQETGASPTSESDNSVSEEDSE